MEHATGRRGAVSLPHRSRRARQSGLEPPPRALAALGRRRCALRAAPGPHLTALPRPRDEGRAAPAHRLVSGDLRRAGCELSPPHGGAACGAPCGGGSEPAENTSQFSPAPSICFAVLIRCIAGPAIAITTLGLSTCGWLKDPCTFCSSVAQPSLLSAARVTSSKL